MFNYETARDNMVESQIRTSDVTNRTLIQAFRSVKREAFVPNSKLALAYADKDIDLGEGSYLLRPRDFAKLVQAADIQPSDVVLDVACGRGYSTAILAQLAETVVALENSPEKVERATQLLLANDVANAAVIEGDLRSGASEHGPFDVIFVNGAISDVPRGWINQLNENGRIVAVMSHGGIGKASVFYRSGHTFGERILFDAHAPALEGFASPAEFVL